ncbi:MAG: SAM-dependent methyltransferase [Bacteroidota bacterium]|nr:SAM-dependent methyltransferase [Candidatus Kapabacteria bacterium]MDW8219069.1 SAM-dependent methyltransferase [Bacteroidota bacterium]
MTSRAPLSRQAHIHPHLVRLVHKHTSSVYQRPIPEFSIQAFQHFELLFMSSGKQRLVIDSGCGTGESTRIFAQQYPSAFVVGLDRSVHRLQKHCLPEQHTTNYALIRAELEDFWRLLASHYGNCIEYHAILYPNPYPKPAHILRRWHGHPLFPQMLALSPITELRTNWSLYAEEFAFAASLLGYAVEFTTLQYSTPITAFERKYQQSGHNLFQVLVRPQ